MTLHKLNQLQLVDTPTGTNNTLRFAVLFTNDVYQVKLTKNFGDVTLSSSLFTAEGYLDVFVPSHAARLIKIDLASDYLNGFSEVNYILINQV
jgi:hypothetical protein